MSDEKKNDVFSRDGGFVARQGGALTGLEVPTHTVPIPSCGRVYSETSPLYNAETVDIRAMTAREEDILSSPALAKKGTIITELIKSCIIDKRIDVNSMLAGDRNALMISVRITGYGQDYEADVKCQHCNEKVKINFDLSQLAIKRLEIDPVVPGENAFTFELPVSKRRVTFKFMTGADEHDLLSEIERRKKIAGAVQDNLVTGRLQRSIIKVDDVTDKQAIANFIRSMAAGDSRALRKFIDENEPGVDMNVNIECPRCAEYQEVQMPLGVAFFWPDA